MPILVQDQTFHLQTSSCSYIFSVTPGQHLVHLYFGAPLREGSVGHLFDARDGRAFSPVFDGISPDLMPQEFPAYGAGDFRAPCVEIQLPNGSTCAEFRYHSHRIFEGKPKLEGLPATYVEDESEAQTLEIELVDEISGAAAILSYSVFHELGAITRSVRIENRSQNPFVLQRILSVSLDFPSSDLDFVQLSGAWARERDVIRAPLRPGTQSVESRRGASSAQANPFFALCSRDATETAGEVWAFNLVYSGNFWSGVERDQFGRARVQTGINPFDFAFQMAPGAVFQAPEAILLYSDAGFGPLSRASHRLIRTRLVRGAWRDKARPILVNSWEASYFNIDEDTIVHLGHAASRAGIELLVMDDGWFGARNDDHTSLGDWFVHPTKFPNGLGSLAARLKDLGLGFGVWFEPEMISADSELYRAHPDWCLHVPERRRTPSRNQLVLDLSRADVCDYLIGVVGDILAQNAISYVKWDMNRHMSEVGSALLSPAQQREVAHRYILGLYRVLETLTARFPDVLFESCSGGGGRFDAGLLHYMPQVWASDNTDAIARLKIQAGTSLAYPAITMGAHLSDSPNHQLHRATPIETRGAVAMAGTFGFELDLNKLSQSEQAALKKQVAFYREVRELVQFGELFRLKSPFEGNQTAWMMVNCDKSEALVTFVQELTTPNTPAPLLKLQGLDPNRDYAMKTVDLGAKDAGKIETPVFGGDVLMQAGFKVHGTERDFAARVWHLTAL